MARKHRRGIVRPWVTLGGFRVAPTGRKLPPTKVLQAPYGSCVVYSNDAETLVQVIATLGQDGGQVVGGGPRLDMRERPGGKSVPTYLGHDPIRMDLSLVLDAWPGRNPRGVMSRLRDLQSLGRRKADWTLPTVRIYGPVPHHDLEWNVAGLIQYDDDPTPINSETGWLRLPLTIPLVERVAPALLQRSIARSARGKGARNGPRFTRVRKNEDGFGDLSKRLYKTRSRAAELARANNMPVGARLRPGKRVRVL